MSIVGILHDGIDEDTDLMSNDRCVAVTELEPSVQTFIFKSCVGTDKTAFSEKVVSTDHHLCVILESLDRNKLRVFS